MENERRLIYIEWNDIVQSDSSWKDEETALDWAGDEDSIARQVGFLLDKDSNYTTLVCSYFKGGMVGTVIRIPNETIKYIKEIEIEALKKI
jgi:hypothetical protein